MDLQPVVLRGRREAEVWRVAVQMGSFRYADLQKELKRRGIRDDHLAMILKGLSEKGLLEKVEDRWVVTAKSVDMVVVNTKVRRAMNLFSMLLSLVFLASGNPLTATIIFALALMYTIGDELVSVALPEVLVYVKRQEEKAVECPVAG